MRKFSLILAIGGLSTAAMAAYPWGPSLTNAETGGSTPWGRVHFDPTNANVIWAATTEVPDPFETAPMPAANGLWKTEDGGSNWTQVNSGTFLTDYHVLDFAIAPSNTDVVYAGTLVEGVFKTTDGGATWAAVNSGISNGGDSFPNGDWGAAAIVVDPTDADKVYASVGQLAGLDILSPSPDHPGFFYSHDGGASWTKNNSGLPPTSDSFVDLSSNTGVASSLVIPASEPSTIYAGILKVDANGKVLFGKKAKARVLVFKNSSSGTGSWSGLSDGLPEIVQDDGGFGSLLRYAAAGGILTVTNIGPSQVLFLATLAYSGEIFLDDDTSFNRSKGVWALAPGSTTWIERNNGLPVVNDAENIDAINASPVGVHPNDPYTLLTGVFESESAMPGSTKIWATTTAGDPWMMSWTDTGLDTSPTQGHTEASAIFVEISRQGNRAAATVSWDGNPLGDDSDGGVYLLPPPTD
ncbi:MAG: hypothetical protein CME06_06350 [Gemmatimonadetes bacterium]|nr:hypothetical protein [Gemmatimonadota bacterium]